ncbi:MAG: PilZ domain-containing protein [Candidatus Omnitrophica bacterium]|nr:PilZ domain-containing protein [Candidatus Omnitrophota bacterium]
MPRLNRLKNFISWTIQCFSFKKRSRRRSKRIPSSQDRRRYPRLETHNLMRVLNVNSQPAQDVMNLVDISESGFQFLNTRRYPASTVLRVIVNVRQIDQQIPMKVKLVWSHPIRLKVVWNQALANSNGSGSHAGASILEMSQEDRRLLKEYIHSKIDIIHQSAA